MKRNGRESGTGVRRQLVLTNGSVPYDSGALANESGEQLSA